MNSLVLRIALFFCLLSLLSHASPAIASTKSNPEFLDIKMTPDRDLASEERGELRAEANELAELLKIKPFVEELRRQKSLGNAKTTQLPKALQHARMLCLWKIFIASQEVRKVVAMINYDLSTTRVNLDSLTTKRDMTINMINTANFMQGGVLGTIKQSLNLHGLHIPAQEIGITTFGTGTVLATTNLFVPYLWTRKIDERPNLLGHIFDANFQPTDAKVSYLWKFMNSPIPGSKFKQLTRREILLKHWKDFEKINIDNERKAKQLSALPPDSGAQMRESIRIISQRMDLLEDLKSHLEEFDASLYELHQSISVN